MYIDRQEVLNFVEFLRSLGNRNSYKNLVDKAQANYQPLTTSDWIQIFAEVKADIRKGSPGHSYGHTQRDFLDTVALATDKNALTYQPAEIQAGILVALHDYGVSFVPRYRDFEDLAGHAELGAYLVYHKLSGLVEENLLLTVCYAIASHTHYLKAMPCKDGSTREPWWYELFEADDKKYGWAILACRFGDRLDTNGSTLLLRHLLANSDAVESGEGGKDLSASDFYDINHETLEVMVTPTKKTLNLSSGKSAPTALQHINNFANSNFGNSIFSRDDHLFPTMSILMGYKVAQTTNILTIASQKITIFDVTKVILGISDPFVDLRKVLYRSDRSPRFQKAWKVLEKALCNLSATELATWVKITSYLDNSYDLWLETLKRHIIENSNEFTKPLLPLIDNVISEIS